MSDTQSWAWFMALGRINHLHRRVSLAYTSCNTIDEQRRLPGWKIDFPRAECIQGNVEMFSPGEIYIAMRNFICHFADFCYCPPNYCNVCLIYKTLFDTWFVSNALTQSILSRCLEILHNERHQSAASHEPVHSCAAAFKLCSVQVSPGASSRADTHRRQPE